MSVKTNQFDGDVSIGRNVALGGNITAQGNAHIKGRLRVDGWLDAPNIKGANKGLFATVGELKKEYPNPRQGWSAIVMDSANKGTGFLYIANNGEWEKTSETANEFEFIADSINVFASKGELEDETLRAEMAERGLLQSITNETIRATEADDNIKSKAAQYNRIGFNIGTDELGFYAGTIDGDNIKETVVPAATTEKAGVMSAADKVQLEQNTTDIAAEITRAMGAEEGLGIGLEDLYNSVGSIKNTAARYDGNAFSTTADEVKLTTTDVDISKQYTVKLPAATTEKAGAMSAADKTQLEQNTINIADERVRAMSAEEELFASVRVLQNPNRTIVYTSTDNNVVVPFSENSFGGATIVSNTYENGRGVMVFDAPITTIGDSAFANSPNLKSIVVPENVKSIGKNAFDGCTQLTKISLPDGLTSIGNSAFYYCGIKSIVIPDSVTSLGTGLFNFSDLTEIKLSKSLKNINTALFGSTSLAEIDIPKSVTEIKSNAFYEASGLKTITIPEGVTKIGDDAFSNAGVGYKPVGDDYVRVENLKAVYVKPTTPPTAGANIFDGLTSFTIYVPHDRLNDYKTKSGWSQYASKMKGHYFDVYDAIDAEQRRAEAAEENLDANIRLLKSPNKTITYTSTDGNIVTPNNPEAFGANIVSNTYENGMGRIEFDAPVTTIGKGAFDSCSNLKSIAIPQGVTTIGDTVFSYCSKLNAVTIPDTVTSIGWGVFAMTDSLVNITIPGSVPVIKHSMFEWSGVKHVTLLEGVTKIENNAFSYSHIASIDIPNSLTSIGDSAFSDCGYLTSIVIPGSVTSIGNIVFGGCYALKSVVLLCDLKNIPNTAFASCGFSTMHIPNTVTSIGDYAFSNCSKLEELTIPEKVTSIGKQAFRYAGVDYPGTSVVKNLKALYIKPSTPPTLGENALEGLDNCQFYVPYDSVEAYKAADGWSAYADRIVGCHYYNEGAIPAATTESAGVMSAEDKSKLKNLAEEGKFYDLNTYTSQGVYLIDTGSNEVQNYPIQTPANSVLRLTVTDSYDGNTHVIVQVLNMNNHVGGEGGIYIRSCQNGNWKAWAKLQTNVEVGLIDQAKMDDLTDNGIYSGILSTTGETFVIICINNYAIAQQVGVQHISHLKYSLVVGTGEIKIEKRTRDAYGFWTEWENIGSSSTLPEATVDTIGGVRLGTVTDNNFAPLVNITENGTGVGIKLDTVYFTNGYFGLAFRHDHTIVKNNSRAGVALGTYPPYTDGSSGSIIPCVMGTGVSSDWSRWNSPSVGILYNEDQFCLKYNGLNLKDDIGSGVTKVTWDASSNMNDFKTPGVYDIYGERTRQDDNLPILNASSGHSIAARLTVVASTLQPANNEICVTQFLMLSNRLGGEGTMYVRTYNQNNSPFTNGWSPWQKQMGMIETIINSNDITVGQEIFAGYAVSIGKGLNGMIDNGMYSGIYTDGIEYTGEWDNNSGKPLYAINPAAIKYLETFVLVVVNDYAASSKLNLPRHITQLKYAVDAITGQSTVKKRVGTGNENISWGDWEDIGGNTYLNPNDYLEPHYLSKLGFGTFEFSGTLIHDDVPDSIWRYIFEDLNIQNSQFNMKIVIDSTSRATATIMGCGKYDIVTFNPSNNKDVVSILNGSIINALNTEV